MSKKLFIITAILVSFPVRVWGAWELQSAENQLVVTGECSAPVSIQLFENENYELKPIYTATASCENGTFSHSDDLLRWSIPEATYQLVIDGERSTATQFTLKAPVMTTEEKVNRDILKSGLSAELTQSANDAFESAQTRFGANLYELQLDLSAMQGALKDTTYPDFIKSGLGGALGVLATATENLASLFFVVEQRDFVDETTSSVGEEATESVSEGEIINEESQEQEAVTEEVTNTESIPTEEVLSEESAVTE